MGRLVAFLGVVQGFRFTVFTIQKVRFSGFTSPNPTHGGRSRLRRKNSGLPTRKVNVSKISRWPPRRRSDASKNNNLREVGFHRRGPKKQLTNGF